MQFLQSILNILMFIISLSLLVMIHELGHFASAKVFKVYCADFSIGFGKAFFRKKRKNGETYFSLRVIPFGGYVAMADDEGEMPDGTFVPKERSINGIKKWKSAIIMSSGVVMNLVLSILLIYFSTQFFPTDNIFYNVFDVVENSPAALAGIRSFDSDHYELSDFLDIKYYYYNSEGEIFLQNEIETNEIVASDFVIADQAILTKNNDETVEYYVTLNLERLTLANLEINYERLVLRQKNVEEGLKDKYVPNADIKGADFETLKNYKTLEIKTRFFAYDEDEIVIETPEIKPLILKIEDGVIESTGLVFYNIRHWNTFTEAWKLTFERFGDGASLIFRSLRDLFTGKGWKEVGGIVAIYSATTSTLNSMGFGYYLYYWGIISINLAIINLIPIPGLDGWHLLVIAFEGIFRKKIPDKVKTVVSYIGLAIMFGLMIILLVKDIFFPIF
ncbi:MAG: RIP metalloprotease RseP [Bacilli bacterium]|nr:RIP metalloprotease RseP [Bacilli bacterium]